MCLQEAAELLDWGNAGGFAGQKVLIEAHCCFHFLGNMLQDTCIAAAIPFEPLSSPHKPSKYVIAGPLLWQHDRRASAYHLNLKGKG